MSTKTKMVCPHCGKELDIEEIYLAKMEKEFEERNKKTVQEAVEFQETEFKRKLDEETERIKREYAERMEASEQLAEEKRQSEKELTDERIKILTENSEKAAAEKKEMLKKQMELEEALRNVESKAQEELKNQVSQLYDKAKAEAEEASKFEIEKLRKKVDDANKAAEDMKKKLEQGSQQLQGEVQELELEECLRTEFVFDDVEEVAKGKTGADVIQTVNSRSGRKCGVIVWESKNVKNWSNEFIPKLRKDMELKDGDVGILVSNVFGKGMEEFTFQDGVWLVKPHNAMAMARMIRDGIEKVSKARSIAENRGTIQDALYEYVTGAPFRNRIELIGRQYRALDEEISKAKTDMNKHYDKQRKMIDELVLNTQGVLGEVEAYMLPEAKESVPELEGGDGE